MEAYELAKISVDAYVQQIANSLGKAYVNLDSTTAKEKLDGVEEIVVAKLLRFDEAPRPPLYDASLIVGIKVHESVQGYAAMELLKQIKARFPVDGQINVGDYGSSDTPAFDGYMVIVRSTVTEAEYEGLNVVQVLQIVLRCMIT